MQSEVEPMPQPEAPHQLLQHRDVKSSHRTQELQAVPIRNQPS